MCVACHRFGLKQVVESMIATQQEREASALETFNMQSRSAQSSNVSMTVQSSESAYGGGGYYDYDGKQP